eukprot:6203873-Pleurochrysis_carterae.AAC.9
MNKSVAVDAKRRGLCSCNFTAHLRPVDAYRTESTAQTAAARQRPIGWQQLCKIFEVLGCEATHLSWSEVVNGNRTKALSVERADVASYMCKHTFDLVEEALV